MRASCFRIDASFVASTSKSGGLMLRAFLSSLLFLLSFSAFAADVITEERVLDLLAREKRALQDKDISGFASLLTEDYESVHKDATVDKELTVSRVMKLFVNVDKMLFMPELVSMKIAEDGKSADIRLRTGEKYLFVRGTARTVDSYTNHSTATVVLEGGTVKYRRARFLGSE